MVTCIDITKKGLLFTLERIWYFSLKFKQCYILKYKFSIVIFMTKYELFGGDNESILNIFIDHVIN